MPEKVQPKRPFFTLRETFLIAMSFLAGAIITKILNDVLLAVFGCPK